MQSYNEIVQQQAQQKKQNTPTPATVRQQAVEIPGVISQTNNLFRPITQADVDKGQK